jgi:hypothetical protein
VFATDSLKDQARANGGKIVAQSQTTMPIGSLATVASGAEVIVQGKILTVEPRLTKDERFVRSYCSILPHRILKDTVGTGSAARPGNTEPLVFAEPGGTVRVDGLEISYRSNLASEPPLEAGEEIIAFLVRAPEWGHFGFTMDPSAFCDCVATAWLPQIKTLSVAGRLPRTLFRIFNCNF